MFLPETFPGIIYSSKRLAQRPSLKNVFIPMSLCLSSFHAAYLNFNKWLEEEPRIIPSLLKKVCY